MNINNVISLPAGEAINAYCRVKVNASGQAVLAGASDVDFFGTNLQDVGAPADAATKVVQAGIQRKAVGTHYAIATAAAIAVGDVIEPAADGKVVKKSSGTGIGQALTACGASGGQIRVYYY